VESRRIERLWKAGNPEFDSCAQVVAARDLARGRGVPMNARIEAQALPTLLRLESQAERLLPDAASRLALSARAVHRTLRVARTIADLRASERISEDAVAEELSFRHEASP